MAFSQKLFDELPIVAILRGYGVEQSTRAAEAAVDGGIVNVEVTMNTADVAGCIAAMAARLAGRANVGAGTVCSLEDLKIALDAGAQFIVTPVVVPDVIAECNRKGIPIICGALTPTEVHQAVTAGADYVKIFPVHTAGGPEYIKALKGPLDQVKYIPTGSVDAENMPAYLRAGAFGFGVGSPVFRKDRIEAEDWAWISAGATRLKEVYLNA
ncbi:hypothetical protein BVY04_02805 [bacterium M21]|nr:hypothetical protein BVY04_02805 [bacterium M21]